MYSDSNDNLESLYDTLGRRMCAEDVVPVIRALLGNSLSSFEQHILKSRLRGALTDTLHDYKDEVWDFTRPKGCERQIRIAGELLETSDVLSELECFDPELVENFIRVNTQKIGKEIGESNSKVHRLNKKQRAEFGLDISRRRYNKLFRLFRRLEKKQLSQIKDSKILKMQKLEKTLLATKLSWDSFSSNLVTACFVAYMSARNNTRNTGRVQSNQDAYDDIADVLFKRCCADPETDWWAIAHVYQDEEVLRKLSEHQKGELLGLWFSVLSEIAELLKEIWQSPGFNKKTMEKYPGTDSRIWNAAVKPWFSAHFRWRAFLCELKLDSLLDYLCPGYVTWMMEYLEVPITKIYIKFMNELPLPWEVLSGDKHCTRSMIKESWLKNGEDPEEADWLWLESEKQGDVCQPGDDFKHGLTASNPSIALVLQKTGWLS